MRRFGALLALLSLLWFSGCGKKESEQPPRKESNLTLKKAVRPPAPTAHRFKIRDIDKRETELEFTEERALFHRIRQPLVMIVLFADWCPPCRGMLPYLSQLQAANSEELFVIGVMVHSDLDDEAMRRFMLRYDTNFFISRHPDNEALGKYLSKQYGLGENYPLPLTLIYKNGKYLMHISGAAPYEILQNLVDQLKEKRSKKE